MLLMAAPLGRLLGAVAGVVEYAADREADGDAPGRPPRVDETDLDLSGNRPV